MRQIREILRLRLECKLPERQVAASIGVSKGSVRNYARKALEAGLAWDSIKEMDEAALEARLFKIVGGLDPRRRVPIDQPWVHREIRRAGVTLYQLWLEYREAARASAFESMMRVRAKPSLLRFSLACLVHQTTHSLNAR